MPPHASLEAEKHGHGRPKEGSLENPEVLENVPGHVIPIIEHEFDDFDTEAGKFLRGDAPEDEFIKFRLRQGVYGQRQPDVQMVRVKLPMGGVTPDQLDAFADVIEKYVPLRKGHITTRQNIQMHHIPLPTMAVMIRELGEMPASRAARAAATPCATSPATRARARSPDELFDITPYAGAYVRYFVRHPTTQMMPRKIKTAFTATDADNAITQIHDIAFTPRLTDGVRGVDDPRRRRHRDHAAPGARALRVRRARQRRLPEGRRGRPPDLRPPGLPARQPRPRPHQGAGRQDRDRRLP